jgi:hypothetical protein
MDTNKLKNPRIENIKFVTNVVIKGLFLFGVLNVLFAYLQPLPLLGKISAYNILFPGRMRLPYGDNPDLSYNLTLTQLDAMFATHEIEARSKNPDEYRVLMIGDSSTWGFLLQPTETISGQLNSLNFTFPDGRLLRSYNLGYPGMSLAKDVLILSYALRFQPDLIIWFVTLESFPLSKQLSSPILSNNPLYTKRLFQKLDLRLNPDGSNLKNASFCNNTIIGQRQIIADMIRLQFYGLMWAATGIDQYIPQEYTPRIENLTREVDFYDQKPPHLDQKKLAFDILEAGLKISGDIPLLFVNEPVFISQGENSDIRYNFYYPRWAYNDYREMFNAFCSEHGAHCVDIWNVIEPSEFTNTAIHMTARGTLKTTHLILPTILQIANEN